MEEVLKKLEEQQAKIDAMFLSVEKLRKYFIWTLVVTIVTVVLPLIVLAFVLPYVISTITDAYGGFL